MNPAASNSVEGNEAMEGQHGAKVPLRVFSLPRELVV